MKSNASSGPPSRTRPSTRSRLAGLMILTLTLSVLLSPVGAQPVKSDRLVEYLTEIQNHLLQSYAFPGTYEPAELLRHGRDQLVTSLQTTDADRYQLTPPAANDLVQRLEEESLPSIRELVRRMKRTQNAFPSQSIDELALADAFASGMLDLTRDDFSHLLTLDDLRALRDRLLGQDVNRSIGLHVTEQDEIFRTNFVRYRSPAYRAGLRSGDRIEKINETPLSETTVTERSRLLKTDPGRTVRITFQRNGWNRPHTVEFKQIQSAVNMVESKCLPSDIGYVRLTRFGLSATGELRSALKQLKEQGMQSIILDLRNNPGGVLPVAVDVTDLFIAGDRLITTTESNFELKGPLVRMVRELLGFKPLSGTRHARTPSPFEELPMCVLINGSSASASELTAGALQDHDRATVVGERSFGKGVGQVAIPLTGSIGLGKQDQLGLFGEVLPTRFLYLTVMEYRLPSGRSIHRRGVQPDRPVSVHEHEEPIFAALLKLRSSDVLTSYVRKQVRRHPDRMKQLAEYDRFSPKQYPAFDRLQRNVNEYLDRDLSRSVLRQELRQTLRNYLRLFRDTSLVVDLQDDPILQQGILHLTEQK